MTNLARQFLEREVGMMRVGAGDRVVVESEKVGQPSRHGVVAEKHGELLTVRWDTGQTTTFIPTAGSLQVESPG